MGTTRTPGDHARQHRARHDDAARTSAEIRRTAQQLRGEATELRAGVQDGLARAARQTGERLIALSAATRDPSATVRRGWEWLTRAEEHTSAAARLRGGSRTPGR